MKLVTLTEKMLPSEFIAELKASGADKDIIYIQPDFKINLTSFSLTLVGGGTETGQDEETDSGSGFDPGLADTVNAPVLDEDTGAHGPGTPDEPEDVAGQGERVDMSKPDSWNENELVQEDDNEPDEAGDVKTPGAPVKKVIVVVIDTGVDIGHELLDGHLHPNAPDTGTNSLSHSHGTHVSGIIASAANETDADVVILPIDVFANGSAYTSDIIAAVRYAQAIGADILNCSFGSTVFNRALYESLEECGLTTICAVGNNRRDFDLTPSYPAGYDLPNIISVASVNADGAVFSYYSNYGPLGIDIAAQGRDVWSSLPGNRYGKMSGTSMSAANVTGAAAAVLSYEEMDAASLKARLTYASDKLSNLCNKVKAGNRLNLQNALAGTAGAQLILDPPGDFDVHGYQPTAEESWRLFSGRHVAKISAGAYHSLALTEDGTVWSWGANWYGQLGNASTEESAFPVQVIGLVDIVDISAGEYYNMALSIDGTLWAWGDNSCGQLGDGTTMTSDIPVQVIAPDDISIISAGCYNSLATDIYGNLWAWGEVIASMWGPGHGDTIYTEPVRADEVIDACLTDIVSASADLYYSLASDGSGAVYEW